MTTEKQWMKRIKNIPLQIEANDHRVYAAYLDVGAFGHVTIPSEIRKDAGIKIGDRVKIIVRKVAGAQMTPAPQPQEYIITEEQIVKIGEAMTKWYLPDAAGSLCFLLRSRPAPSPQEPCDTCSFNDVCSMQASESCKRAMQEQHDTRPHTPSPQFNSTELLLLAHDEWKRRQERKHLDDETAWVSGFIGGFITDKTWAKDKVDSLHTPKEQP